MLKINFSILGKNIKKIEKRYEELKTQLDRDLVNDFKITYRVEDDVFNVKLVIKDDDFKRVRSILNKNKIKFKTPLKGI